MVVGDVLANMEMGREEKAPFTLGLLAITCAEMPFSGLRSFWCGSNIEAKMVFYEE
jgi:hypothetical protein